MRTYIIFLTALITFIGSAAYSQIEKGTIELSVSGTAGSYKYTEEYTEVTTDPIYGSQTLTHGHSQGPEKYLMMFIRPGYYIIDRLAIEPEFMWTTMDGTEPSLSVSGNVSYNLAIPNSSLTSFLFAGYGIGNSIPFNYTLIFRMTDDMDVKLINLGAGLKAHLTERVVFRVEYRYQMYSMESEYSYSYYSSSYKRTTKTDFDFHNLFFGFSYIIRK
ncbi:MAG: outer membrane beta-barrel protein [Candidatus Zhuqueibacterota bacterium]